LARGAYAEFTQWTRKRVLTYTQLAIAQHVPVQMTIAEIAAQIDAAELLGRRCLAVARRDYSGMTMATRALLRRDFTYAMRMVRDAMDMLIKISGSAGLMDSNPLQRCWRDVHAISSHVVMNWDVPAENFGRMELVSAAMRPIPRFERAYGQKNDRENPAVRLSNCLLWLRRRRFRLRRPSFPAPGRSLPRASTSRSTNSITALAALSP